MKNFAKTQEMAARIKNHDVRKEYVCRVMGEFPTSSADVRVQASGIGNDDDEGGGGVMVGNPSGDDFPSDIVVDAPLLCVSQKIGLNRVDARGKEARTTFRRLSYNGTSSVVKCIPKTGRTHQIRVSPDESEARSHLAMTSGTANSKEKLPC